MFWTRLRGCEGIFANSNDIVLFLVRQARCLQHAYLIYEEIFKGTLAEVKTSITAILCARSNPRIMHKFTWWIDLNVSWQKAQTRSQKDLSPLNKMLSVHALLAAVVTQVGDEIYPLLARGWEAESRMAASSFAPIVQLFPLQPPTLVRRNQPDPSQPRVPALCCFEGKVFHDMVLLHSEIAGKQGQSQVTSAPVLEASASSRQLFWSGWFMW